MKNTLMNDPLYAQIVFLIESKIHDADCAAASAGIELKDSQIKSCLNKVKTFAKGRRPKAEPKNAKEKIVFSLAESLHESRERICVSSAPDAPADEAIPIAIADWLAAIDKIEESLKVHTLPGTRNYLDFIANFLAKAVLEDIEENKRSAWWKRIFKRKAYLF